MYSLFFICLYILSSFLTFPHTLHNCRILLLLGCFFFLLFSPIPKKVSVVLADHKRADSKTRDKPLDKLLSMDEQRTGLGVGGWRGCGMHAGLWCCRGTQIVHSLDISCNKGLPLSTCCVAASRASVEWL